MPAKTLFAALITIFSTILLAEAVDVAPKAPGGASKLEVVLEQPLVVPGPNILVTSVHVTYPPGDPGPPVHYHSGPTIGFVIEGEMLFQVKGQPPRIVPAGSAVYELDRATHIWGGNASNTTICRVVATVYGRPQEPYVTFLHEHERESRDAALAKARKHH